jgi:hypothetical protein
VLAAWPLLLAAAPTPPNDFAAGVNGPARAMGPSFDDARAAGFNAVRIFLRWDEIETTEGAPDWSCKYVADADTEADGDLRPGLPCDGTPCGCGYSADERVAAAARRGVPILLTIVSTPEWARGQAAAWCPMDTPPRALPLRRDKESAYRDFVGKVAARYGEAAFAFELWNEPDLDPCRSWAGTREQYKAQILSAATVVKQSRAVPGLVVAPTLENPSPSAMESWIDWSQPIDRLSFNLYEVKLSYALQTLDQMAFWCNSRRRCPGFYVTEFGAQRTGGESCPGPRSGGPGPTNVQIMKRCRKRPACRGFFLYSLMEDQRPQCDRGLFTTDGCRKRRLCTIAKRFFRVSKLPYDCVGCGP